MRRECDGKETPGVAQEDGKEKSERKRQREKQRRSELTNAFDDLAALVLKMDSADDVGVEEGEGGGNRNKKNRRMSGRSEHENESSGGMTRVDLINRALAIMKRLHQENAELKQSLARGGGRDKNEVMVMVPTLTPADDATSFRPPYVGGFQSGPPPPLAAQQQPEPHPQPGIYGAQSRYPPPPQHYYGGAPPGPSYGEIR